MKTILVPIDFSENGDKALAAAKQIAVKTGAKLSIMYAHQPYVGDYMIPESIGTAPIYPQLEDDYRAKLNQRVSNAQQEGYRADAIFETDSVETAVLRQAKEISADLIIVGRTGHRTFLDKLIGSSATGIALHAHCPVLIIPPESKMTRFDQIVYATQLEFDEKQILLDVVALSKQLKSKLQLVKVNSDEQLDIQPDGQYINEIERELGIDRGDIAILNGDHVMDRLGNYCDQIKADLLIVSNRRRGFLEKLLNPSMTKKLTVDTQVPLLVYHKEPVDSDLKAPMVILS
ncbi:universal stress protein [Dyadobacter pollutisoli]|uniref:Universal stress protein n=1 Tax=Dyadobacter pollutisoli TaxID=2910158 RepID=A0A9E8NEE9_9BACT|nr:universal stress protein [Dyadobacter pollutisoli]WAC13462.1 universal stress protein [Dyadobacter pollutisoli]